MESMHIVNSFGACTARHCACLPHPSTNLWRQQEKILDFEEMEHGNAISADHVECCKLVDVPLGCCVARWKLLPDNPRRLLFFRAHNDVITCLLKPFEGAIVTVSEAGEIALWDTDWNLLDRAHHSKRVKITHASFSISKMLLLTSSEFHKGLLTVFEVKKEKSTYKLQHRFDIGEDCHYTLAEWTEEGFEGQSEEEEQHYIFAIKQQIRRRDLDQDFFKGIEAVRIRVTADGKWQEDKKRDLNADLIEQLNAEHAEMSQEEIHKLIKRVTSRAVTVVSKNQTLKKTQTAAVVRGSTIDIIDMRSLATLWRIESGGTGIKCVFLRGTKLLCPMVGSRLGLWKRGELIEWLTLPLAAAGSVYFMESDSNFNNVLIVNESGLHSFPLHKKVPQAHRMTALLPDAEEKEEQSHSVSFHGMTCCGIDFNYEGDKVVVGDFAGNVIIWDTRHYQPIKKIIVPVPVRSLCWNKTKQTSHGDEASVQTIHIGCVGGAVYLWKPDQNDEPTLWTMLDDTVTCLKWEHGHKPYLLAAATTEGTLYLLSESTTPDNSEDPNATPNVVMQWKAHAPVPGPQNLQFGSIGKYAEIWSIAWSPDNKYIATSSEDQQTVIWNMKGEKQRTLSGHTTAVTGVDWQVVKIRDSQTGEEVETEVLATCADDQRVMVWDASSWKLLQEWTTSEHVHEWHTLTYLALQRGGDKVFCATQNGAIAVWSLNRTLGQSEGSAAEPLLVRKTHLGSVEGLCCSPQSGLVASCSSDCTVHLYCFDAALVQQQQQ